MTLLDLDTSNDHDLLLGGVANLVAENTAAAERGVRLLAFYRRHEADDLARDPDDHFALSARHLTEIEVSELWALPRSWVRRQLNNALWTSTHFSYLWGLAQRGAIDAYRSALIAETARNGLDTDAEYAALSSRLTRYLQRHLRDDGLVTCTTKQLRNKLAYEIKVLRSTDAEERFRRVHAARDVQTNHGEGGMSWLTIGGTTDQVALAAHRLTLNARELRSGGDERTIEQLRADLALGILVNGTIPGAAPPAYARPIINLTVPIQTVMGLSDHPGVLSGGTVIPAGLARIIATRPGAAWHRMLTDPAGQAVELSTERYQPTPAIWEQVVAVQPTCFREACDDPATTCDLDHRVAWPAGPTSSKNLTPACRTDHRAKHSDGFSVEQTPDGGFTFSTPAGFTHAIGQAQHPTDREWPEIPEQIQFSATEIVDALEHLRAERTQSRPQRPDLIWEYNLNFGLMYEAA